MISTTPESDQINPDEERSEDSIKAGLHKELVASRELLAALQAHRESKTFLIIQNKLNEHYKTNFAAAASGTNDDRTRVNALERNLGITTAMRAVDDLIIQLEDDIKHLQRELSDD